MTVLIAFTWRAPVDGDGFSLGRNGPVEFDVIVPRAGAEMRSYSPLVERPGLHLDFAALTGTPKSFLEFANTYGGLLIGGGEHGLPCELILDWRRLHALIGHLAEVWSLCEAEDAGRLGQRVHWNKKKELIVDGPPIEVSGEYGAGIPFRWPREEAVEFFGEGEVIGPARHYVAALVNRVLWEVELFRPGPRLAMNGRGEEPGLAIHPKNLAGALLANFWTAIHDGKRYRPCAVCAKYFEISKREAGHTRNTCSGACRVRLHRQRKETG